MGLQYHFLEHELNIINSREQQGGANQTSIEQTCLWASVPYALLTPCGSDISDCFQLLDSVSVSSVPPYTLTSMHTRSTQCEGIGLSSASWRPGATTDLSRSCALPSQLLQVSIRTFRLSFGHDPPQIPQRYLCLGKRSSVWIWLYNYLVPCRKENLEACVFCSTCRGLNKLYSLLFAGVFENL